MKDGMHLLRLGAVIGAAVGVFVVLRPFFVPATFGDLGHYRAAAVVEARARPLQFADGTACESCHGDVVELRVASKSRHGAIRCQSCHGPLAGHVESGGEHKPARPETPRLCLRCHEETAGRPRFMPQVTPADHSGGERCTTCHAPHAPGLQ